VEGEFLGSADGEGEFFVSPEVDVYILGSFERGGDFLNNLRGKEIF